MQCQRTDDKHRRRKVALPLASETKYREAVIFWHLCGVRANNKVCRRRSPFHEAELLRCFQTVGHRLCLHLPDLKCQLLVIPQPAHGNILAICEGGW